MHGDTLKKRLEARLANRLLNAWQRQEYDLQRLAAAGFEVGQKPQFFKQIGVQMMRLVDHQNGATLFRAGLEQLIGQPQPERLFRGDIKGQSEIVEDRLQEGRAIREVAIRQECVGNL